MPTRGRYTDVLDYGYLDVLQHAHERYGRAPDWLQTFILYELELVLLRRRRPSPTSRRPAHGETAREDARADGPDRATDRAPAVMSFRDRRAPAGVARVLLHSYDDTPWHSQFALVDKLDTDQRLVRVTYRFVGPCPSEQFFTEGVPARPVYAKTRSLTYFDRTMMHERIVWLPSGAIRVELDDVRRRRTPRRSPSFPATTCAWEASAAGSSREARTETRKRRLPPRPRRPRRSCSVAQQAGQALVRGRLGAARPDRGRRRQRRAVVPLTCARASVRKVNAWFVLAEGHVGRPSVAQGRVQAGHPVRLAALEAADAQLPAPRRPPMPTTRSSGPGHLTRMLTVRRGVSRSSSTASSRTTSPSGSIRRTSTCS